MYKTKSIHIYTQTKLSKRKIYLNPKIKFIQSLTKYPQNWTNSTQSLNHTNTNPAQPYQHKAKHLNLSLNPAINKPTTKQEQQEHQNKPTLQPTTHQIQQIAASQPLIETNRPRQIGPTEGVSIWAREREKHSIEPKRETH